MLKELRNKRANLHAQWKALIGKEGELAVGEELPPEDVTTIEDLKTQIAVLDARIVRVEEMLAAEGEDAKPGVGADGQPVEAAMAGRMTAHGSGEPPVKTGKGYQLARFMLGVAWAKADGRASAAAEIERKFGDREVAKALNTSGTGTGGALVPQSFLPDLIDLLRAESVIRQCEPMLIDMPGGNMTIPRLASGATANWQGELDDMSVSQPTFDDLQLNAKKLTAMVPVSNDLIRRSALNVEEIIRNDLVQVISLREDLAELLSDGSGGSPVGLFNLCAASNKLIAAPFADQSNATILNATVGVLQGMVASLKNNMSRMIRPRWIFPVAVEMFLMSLRDGVGNFVYQQEMLGGKLLGIPYKVTQQLATNLNTGTAGAPINNGSQIYLADFADVIVADTLNYRIDIADQASYSTGGQAVSAFQRDQTVFRVIKELDFNIRHQASVAVAQVPGWAPAGFTATGGSSFYVQAPSNDASAAASTFGAAAPTGSNNPANIAANVPGGLLPGRP